MTPIHAWLRSNPRSSAFIRGLLLSLFLASPALADRASVETVMRDMERAVLAGDVDGYLKHVDPTDPVFLKEQQNWAADLKRYVPAKFTLTIAEPKPEEPHPADAPSSPAKEGEQPTPAQRRPSHVIPATVFDDEAGKATFEMTFDWSIKVADGGRERTLTRSVSFPVLFVRTGINGDSKWLYKGEDWIIVESEPDPEHPSDAPNRAFCYPGSEEAARNAVAVLPEVRRFLDEGFGVKIDRVQEVKIYPTMRHLQESIYLSYGDSLGGWNEPDESIKTLASARTSKEGLRRVLAHEYGHVATFAMGPRANDMPWWVLEGVAELAAEKWAGYAAVDRRVRAWARDGELVDWAELADFHSVKPQNTGHVYDQGHHLVGYVSEKWQRKGRNDWLRAMANGATLEDATKSVLGLSFAELDAQWRASLTAEEPESTP